MPLSRPSTAALLLATFMLLPPAVAYLLPVSSFTTGTIAACIAGLALVPLGWSAHVVSTSAFKSGATVLGLILAIHFVIASFLTQTDTIRFIGSAIIMLLVYATASVSSKIIYHSLSRTGINSLFLLMLLFIILARLGVVIPGPGITPKSVFPFNEPSFFGLAFLPLLLWRISSTRGWHRLVYIVIGLTASLLLQNLTMLAGTILILLSISSIPGVVALTGLLVGALVFSGFDLTYYTERLDFSEDNVNVSTLAYIQGWQMMDESLTKSSGWGVGFSQMGVFGSDVDAAELINLIVGEYMNLTDGTFIFSRLVSDFGIFGIIAVIVYVYFVGRSFIALRRYSLGRLELLPGAALAHSILVMSVIDVFVRGIGYLTGSMIIFISAYQFLYSPLARPQAGRITRQAVAS